MQSYGRQITEIPLWQKYTLIVEEASLYFRIGQAKLRRLINENGDADFILWNGNRPISEREAKNLSLREKEALIEQDRQT